MDFRPALLRTLHAIKRPSTGPQNALLNSVSLHMRESFSKRRGGGHRSSPFIVSFAPKWLLQSAKLHLDDFYLKRVVPLGECECTGGLNLRFHRIKQRATFAAGPTALTSDLVLAYYGVIQTNILAVRFPTPELAQEISQAEGSGTYGPRRPWL